MKTLWPWGGDDDPLSAWNPKYDSKLVIPSAIHGLSSSSWQPRCPEDSSHFNESLEVASIPFSLSFLATPCGMWDLSFKTSDQIHAYCIGALGAWSLNHWTAKEVLHSLLYSLGMMLAKDDSPMAAESDTTEQLNWTEGYLSWTSSFSVDSPSLFRWQKMCISFPAEKHIFLKAP